jgi:hypothetical protein
MVGAVGQLRALEAWSSYSGGDDDLVFTLGIPCLSVKPVNPAVVGDFFFLRKVVGEIEIALVALPRNPQPQYLG